MKWTETIYNKDSSKPVLYSKTLLNLFFIKFSLHKIVRADDVDCFHSHPAHAIRFVLRGGYIEEVYRENKCSTNRVWKKWNVGWVKPNFTHRIESLFIKIDCYTLWISLREKHKIKLIGKGWN